nr:MFS transporter [Trinickia dinghuensis]
MANLYYAQPLAGSMCASFGVPIDSAGLLTTVPLGAYGVGLLTIVPLADRIDNRTLVLALTTLVIACTLLSSTARNLPAYLLAAALLGVAATAVQVLVPYSTYLVAPHEATRAVGRVVSGVMLGIMAARPAASLIASFSDWRGVFRCSAAVLAVVLIVLAAALPARQPSDTGSRLSYGVLMKSLLRIVAREPVLRLRAGCHGCMFGAFATFWTAVPLWLIGAPLRMSQAEVGWVGLAGVAGALAPPIAGRIAANKGPRAARTMMLIAGGAFAFSVPVTLATHAGSTAIACAMAAVGVALDFAVASHLVLCQQAIYALAPRERSRVNAIFMASFLMIGSVSSALAGWLLAKFGWDAVAALGAGLPLLAWMMSQHGTVRQ